MAYRNDLEALRTRESILATEVADRERDLAATRNLIDEVQARAKLPVLPNIRVAAPCRADWNAMTGDARVRACGECNKRVYNLSEMTRDEAEALIVEKEGKLCVRYFQRKDGTILLKDCAIGVGQRRRMRIVAAGAALVAASGIGAGALARHLDHARSDGEFLMGATIVHPVVAPDHDLIPMMGEPAFHPSEPPAPIIDPTPAPPTPTIHPPTVRPYPKVAWPEPAKEPTPRPTPPPA